MNNAEEKVSQKIALACRIAYEEGLCENLGAEFAGHISVKVAVNRILMPGHLHGAGRGMRDIIGEDIIAVDMDGKLLEGKHEPVEEVIIHTSIYKAREDAVSVAHLHPQFVTAIASTNATLIPISLTSCYFVATPVLDTGPALLISEKTTSKMVKKLGKGNAIIHKGHGIVTVGKTLQEACMRAMFMEGSAKRQYIASHFGKLLPFTRADAIRFAEDQNFAINSAFWNYYENKWKSMV